MQTSDIPRLIFLYRPLFRIKYIFFRQTIRRTPQHMLYYNVFARVNDTNDVAMIVER